MTTAVALGLALAGCGGARTTRAGRSRRRARARAGRRVGQRGEPREGPRPPRCPVEVAAVARQSVASYIQTNGSLEAENDVQIVARTQGPIVELLTEEGRRVSKGQLMARIDPKETGAQTKIAEVTLQEAERVYERAQETFEEQLISQADFDAALAAKESAEATLVDRQVQLDYTEVRAPFSAVVVDRNIKLGDNVTVEQVLFRISDFDPLLCKIQVPEKELPRLHKGQPAYLTVEAWPGRALPGPGPAPQPGRGRRHRHDPGHPGGRGPVASCGPGMFASVYLEIDRHEERPHDSQVRALAREPGRHRLRGRRRRGRATGGGARLRGGRRRRGGLGPRRGRPGDRRRSGRPERRHAHPHPRGPGGGGGRAGAPGSGRRPR